LNALNPKATVFDSDQIFSEESNGLITDAVSEALENKAYQCVKSDNFFKRHIASRLTYSLLAVSSVITRLADLINGVVAAVFSFLSMEKSTL